MTFQSVRAELGVVGLVIFALVSNAQLLRDVVHVGIQHAGSDELTRYDTRFSVLRAMLPPSGLVGYVADQPLMTQYKDGVDQRGAVPRLTEQAKQFVWTQYALAPVRIGTASDYRLVVGNFHQETSVSEVLRREGLTVVEAFGDGVYLFRRTVK